MTSTISSSELIMNMHWPKPASISPTQRQTFNITLLINKAMTIRCNPEFMHVCTLCSITKCALFNLVETATSAVHVSHSEFCCRCVQNITVIQPNRSYQSYTQCTYVVPISTSGMLAHILTDCSRGTGEGQGEEEEDTEEGQEVETASGRPSRANWHL